MTDAQSAQNELDAFAQAYSYDTGYLSQLLQTAPGAYTVFQAAQGLSTHREHLPLDAHFVARVATMQAEDCGGCTQLNLRMAVEAGVDRELLRTLLETPKRLPEPLRDIRDHAQEVARAPLPDPERAERIRRHYGDAAFGELGAVIAGCRIYPTLKRSLLRMESCPLPNLDF